MWFWGSVLGLLAGASIASWSGAFWGAIIGWLAGFWLSKQGRDTEIQTKNHELSQQLAATQRALQDVQRRLARLEHSAVIATASAASAAPPAPEGSKTPEITAEPVKPDSAPRQTADTSVPLATATTAEKRVLDIATMPASPAGPRLIERLLEGNVVAKIGVIVLFFGVGFLLKFAYDRGMFPPGMRLIAVAAASGVMFLIGRRLMESSRTYALVLMGGAMGLLYLDVFFALKSFALIGSAVGFALFAALGISTLMLAVRMDARAFAALGLLGAFLAPVLASTGSGNHVLLFSYYLLLNLVILAASWFKSWRELNFIGFLFTFAIALLWGNSTYRPAHFATVEPFLIAFFLLYLAIPILFSHRQPPRLKGIVDGTLVFGVPMSVAMLQAALTRGLGDNILAWSALGAALVYGGLAWALWRRESMRLLAEAHLALAIVFGTVAPYFAFNGYPTFAFWTLEGAAIFWVGARQKSTLARAFALCLQLGAALYFWSVTHDQTGMDVWWNDRVIGCGLIALAGFVTAWFLHKFTSDMTLLEKQLEPVVVTWAALWWLLGLHNLIDLPASTKHFLTLHLVAAAVSIAAFEWIGKRMQWTALRRTEPLLCIALLSGGLHVLAHYHPPFYAAQSLAWALGIGAAFWALWRQQRDEVAMLPGAQCVALFALATWLIGYELQWRVEVAGYSLSWRYATWGATFAISLALITRGLAARLRESTEASAAAWPIGQNAAHFQRFGALPLLVLGALWVLGANMVCDGQSQPLPYLPVLNPLDLAHVALFGAAAWACQVGVTKNVNLRASFIAFAGLVFVWINAVILRTVHHWAEVPFELGALLHSVVAQSALSIVWTATALILMFVAGKRQSRTLWKVGAALLGVVVLKLFVNDLGNTGTIARIVSFLGVGVLLLVAGYVAPVPPKNAATPTAAEP